MVTVPCNGCTLCCKREAITLLPEEGDNPEDYGDALEEGIPGHPGVALVLKHKPNGDCIFLGDGGCTIYDKRPVICRHFDCRASYLKISAQYDRNQRRRLCRSGQIDMAVYRRGRELAELNFSGLIVSQ